jgi:hypothetical protein
MARVTSNTKPWKKVGQAKAPDIETYHIVVIGARIWCLSIKSIVCTPYRAIIEILCIRMGLGATPDTTVVDCNNFDD